MATLVEAAQNTSKLGAVLNSGFYEKTAIDWLIENLGFLVCFTCLLNYLNPSSVEKAVFVLLRLRRLN